MNEGMFDAAYALVDEIKTLDAYNLLKESEAHIAASKEVQALIQAFKETEENYNEVKKYSSYHPDYKSTQMKFREASFHLFRHPLIKTYKAHEKALNEILETVADRLAKCISPRLSVEKSVSVSTLGGKACKSVQH